MNPNSDFQFSTPWLIPLFPLLGFLFCGLARYHKAPNKVVGWVATVAVFASFAVALSLFSMFGADTSPHVYTLARWFEAPAFNNVPALSVNFDLLIDHLSLLMLLIITGVGGLIHMYSIGYMEKDSGFARFFTYLNLFIFFMLLLVLGNNMVLMFVGWEGVGLCSYLLIGFWYEKKSAADAAKKAMIVNRIGDVGVLIGMFLAFQYFGTLDFHQPLTHRGILDLAANNGVAAWIAATPAMAAAISLTALMIFWGCTGKSAQLPLYTWLPDAMEGPTPVSALIHAATMVTAGVYLVSRMHSVFELSYLAMVTVAVIGIATALFAASIGLVQNDIKRVLAYSTMSQLGYMFAACGVGAFSAGMFHVMTHAFFKACLFLGSGAVIHAMEHAIHARHEAEHGGHDAHVATPAGGPDPDDPQDIRNMGGLSKRLPLTFWFMLFGTLAIAGIPLFSGFFSKDEILYEGAQHSWLLWLIGALTAAMTAFYMTRMMYKTFGGTAKTADAEHAREAPPVMWIPVGILGVLAIVGGYVGLPAITHAPNLIGDFLRPTTEPGAAWAARPLNGAPEGLLLAASSAIAIVFVLATFYAYKAKDGRDLLLTPEQKAGDTLFAGVYRGALNKWYVDEAYNFWFVRIGGKIASVIYKTFDLRIVDGLVNAVAWIASQTGAAFRGMQNGYVRNYAFTILIAAIVLVIVTLVGFHSPF